MYELIFLFLSIAFSIFKAIASFLWRIGGLIPVLIVFYVDRFILTEKYHITLKWQNPDDKIYIILEWAFVILWIIAHQIIKAKILSDKRGNF